jgi:predicted nucleic acid-binding protein
VICVDSSVAAKWLFAEEHSAEADELLRTALEQQEPIVAPPLLPAEVTNIIRQRLRQAQLRLDEGRELLVQFMALPIAFQPPQMLYDRVLVLTDQYNLPAVYDANYLALAEMLGATLWTADQRLLPALGGRLAFVRSIADYGA